MSTCTPIYRLPYVAGYDRPCDVGDTLCGFAAAVETRLDVFDAAVDRIADSVPLVRVRMTNPFSFNNGIGANQTIGLPFDTVDVDTANMVDLVASPYNIVLPFPGRYIASFEVWLGTTVPANDEVSAALVTAKDGYISDASVPVYLNSSASFRYATAPTTRDTSTPTVNLNASFFSAGVFTFTYAMASIFWIGDLP